jgi:hypothetical protein
MATLIQNPPRDHHYIPVFYLKRWTAKKRLVEFSKPYGDIVKTRTVHPRGTGYVNRLYSVRGLPPALAEQVETEFFRPVDDRASNVLAGMEAGRQSFTSQERVAWAQFLVSLRVRTPEMLAAANEQLRLLLPTTDAPSEARYRKQRRPTDPPTLREFMAAYVEDKDAIARRALKVITEVTHSEKLFQHILGMMWGCLTLSHEVPALLTSDRPVRIIHGLENRRSEILVPIGPKRVFYAVQDTTLAHQLHRVDHHRVVHDMNLAWCRER